MKRQSTIILILVAAGLIALYLHLTPPPSSAPSPQLPPALQEQRVMLYHYWDSAFDNLRREMNRQGEQFNSRTPTHRLVTEAITHEAYKSNVRAMLEAGSNQELFSYWAGHRTKALTKAGLLAPIDAFWQTDRLDNIFPPAVRDRACSYNGHKYLLPLVQSYVGFFYNQRLFDEHQLTIPKTWAEFQTLCATLKSKGIHPVALGTRAHWPAQFWFDYLLLRTQGAAYRRQLLDGKIPYNDPPVRRAFSLWKELVKAGYFAPNPNAGDWEAAAKLVHSHGAAMTLMGTWTMDSFYKWGWQGIRDFGFFPFPKIATDQPPVTLTVIDGLILSRGSEGEGAHRVLRFFSSRPAQEALCKASGNFSASREVPLDFYSPLHQRILQSVGADLAFPYDLDTPPEVERVFLPAFSRFLDAPDQDGQILDEVAQRITEVWRKLRSPR